MLTKLLYSFLFLLLLYGPLSAQQENKAERLSPPASTRAILGRTRVQIDYSQPSLKGRMIGKDVEPMNGKVWRAGANEATVFSTDKNVNIEGQPLPAGRYALFMIASKKEWTVILNKKADQWGAFDYKQSDDVLRVKVIPGKTPYHVERLTYLISREGLVSLWWGSVSVSFQIN